MSKPNENRLNEALIALRRILRATELYERELAQAARLTPAKLRVLQILASREGGSATPTALANQMGVSQATVTALVDQLQKREMVSRQRSSMDRRQTNVVIAEAGTEALKNAPSALQQHFVRNFEKLENWEQQMVLAVLERVAAMLNAGEIEASPVLTIGDIRKDRDRL
ncbi:MarR family winged helix-turn-helix transcriptional regulator [Paracoccus alkanivorans]|uniref:MarR family transcriptional regulator n=1 Tax=Paracoccus alkanivorans TaxID=2116655 RepID=A0A3M0M9I6_9RHOB|nr:MarR family transcriptional regulator [Paracoccus alkanivorans]RMC34309.1 MarR family transcriptional regulator [Paracoccus alkanivorans]